MSFSEIGSLLKKGRFFWDISQKREVLHKIPNKGGVKLTSLHGNEFFSLPRDWQCVLFTPKGVLKLATLLLFTLKGVLKLATLQGNEFVSLPRDWQCLKGVLKLATLLVFTPKGVLKLASLQGNEFVSLLIRNPRFYKYIIICSQ